MAKTADQMPIGRCYAPLTEARCSVPTEMAEILSIAGFSRAILEIVMPVIRSSTKVDLYFKSQVAKQ